MIVEHTADFERIRVLPRRDASKEYGRAMADQLTPKLALAPDARMLPWQALALAEAVMSQGAFIALPVGQGKTLISWLLPLMLQAKRALLLVPPALLQKTHADFQALSQAWRGTQGALRVVSYRQLEIESGASLLDQYAPDLLIADESDTIANYRTSCARRIARYKASHPACRVVAMTGTPARKSILDYWHWLVWCLGVNAPVPLRRSEAFVWSRALDMHDGMRPDFDALGPTLDAARDWYRQRLVSTPGVLVVDEDSCTAPLSIRVVLAPEDPILDSAFGRLLLDDEVPGGEPITTPLSRWLIAGQLGLGYYTRWDPPPPEAWCDARREVARFVRDRIEASTRASRPLDTEAQVYRAYPKHPAVTRWLGLKPTFSGTTEAVWLTESTLRYCAAWLAQDEPGIVWSGSVDFSERLAPIARASYYGPRGLDASQRSLHAAPQGSSFVASWNANKRGFNLQHWRRHLIVMPPQSAKWLEQIFGRSHRRGQTEGVRIEILATSGATFDLVRTAIEEASKIADTENMTQKVLRAKIDYEQPNTSEANSFRWARRDT